MSDPAERCPACAAAALAPWRMGLLRCAACGTARAPHAPPEDAHEEAGYGAGDPRLTRLARPVLERWDAARLALVADVVAPPGRLLDAGAGRGRFVASARRAGWTATGVEPSSRGTEAAARNHGIELVRATIEDAPLPPGGADAVVCWHVLEHVEDPEATLRAIRGWLRPGGALVVGVPNRASLQAWIGGRRWFHLDPPRHRTHFTPRGLRALLERTGFGIVRERHVLLEHNPFGMWQTLVSRVTRRPSYLYDLLKRTTPLDARDLAVSLALLPLAPVAALLELLAGAAGRGGTVGVSATKVP